VEHVDYVYQVLTQPDAEPTLLHATVGQKQKDLKYQMLPHVRPGGLLGLMEMLPLQGDSDLYRLSEDLLLEVDDLFPILEAGSLLGFLRVTKGEVAVTQEGRRFVNADILTQKEIFRDSVLAHVVLIDQIRRALAAKPNQEVSAEFFGDVLEEHFTEAEVQRQLDTAVTWGRYAELFDYDAARKRFIVHAPEPVDARPVSS